jgi:hypothetical protein
MIKEYSIVPVHRIIHRSDGVRQPYTWYKTRITLDQEYKCKAYFYYINEDGEEELAYETPLREFSTKILEAECGVPCTRVVLETYVIDKTINFDLSKRYPDE